MALRPAARRVERAEGPFGEALEAAVWGLGAAADDWQRDLRAAPAGGPEATTPSSSKKERMFW